MPLSLAEVLQNAVRNYPGRPALALPGGAGLRYADLDRRSAAVAARLLSLGVGRGDRVGILVPKSLESVVGVWGVLRTGAAYVPLDPAAPPKRAAFIAADCAMKATLVSSDVRESVEAIREAAPAIDIVQVHGEDEIGGPRFYRTADGERVAPPRVNVRDLAYILYTSGSTGVPKGVMVSHGAALSFVEWAAGRFALVADDVVSSHAPLHFDLSTFDLFASALAGARVVVLDDEVVRFPAASAAVLESERISVWYSTPGALRKMLSAGLLSRRDLRSLRTVLFAGEVYPAGELRGLQEALAHVALYNLYGPTETNVCTYWPVPPVGTWKLPSIPIGADCENCEGVVVDDELRPVPDGVAGELLVRGGTLMEGYWGNPERTAASFVPDFLHPHLADRFYRTGDRVTREPDGSYAFHGRGDHQVKVRGYRVELGEIEAVLHRVPDVSEAAVVAVAPAEGLDLEVVAFVVAGSRAAASPGWEAALRKSVAALLPRYMVPSAFLVLPRLPATSTGKVDRQALAAAARERGSALKEGI